MSVNNRNILIHILGSIAFLSFPIFSSPDFNTGKNLWIITPFLNNFCLQFLLLIFFYINHYILLPNFYFKDKKFIYLIFILLFLIVILKVPDYFFPFEIHKPNAFSSNRMEPPKFDFHFIREGLIQFVLVIVISFLIKLNKRYDDLKNEKQVAEISYLKAQINPHFLFNTLNSLYALTIQKSDLAPVAVLKLSGIMRYVVTESSQEFVTLEKEINYISDYIQLQKIRLDESVNFKYETKGQLLNKSIAPLILIPFIENAFKYGINPDEDSFIHISIETDEKYITLEVENSIVNTTVDETSKTEEGLRNTKKRLEIIYPDKHELTIHESEKKYDVTLKIDLT
ncbi:MAG TPA: histidine kinase [Flavobacterium lutivivi]|nr:histidine kinase [Flavobacterium lutivivi]